MKTKIHYGRLSLEDFSKGFQIAIAQLQDAGIDYVEGVNLYYTPVDEEGREITLWDDKLKKGKKVAREKFVVKLDDVLN